MTESLVNTIKAIAGSEIAGNRVHVVVDLNESHTKPNLAMVLIDSTGNEVSRSIIMGVLDSHVEFTLHIRVSDAQPPFTLNGITYIEEDHPIDSKKANITGLA